MEVICVEPPSSGVGFNEASSSIGPVRLQKSHLQRQLENIVSFSDVKRRNVDLLASLKEKQNSGNSWQFIKHF